jgi:hypothetical protein
MTGHDHSASDDIPDLDDNDAVDEQRIRINPSVSPSRLETATSDTERIRINPSSTTRD